MLIKPKRITITSKVGGSEKDYQFNIGRYGGLDGLDMIEYATDILKSGINFSNSKKGLLRECLIRMGRYIEIVVSTPEGEKNLSLEHEKILDANIPDPEVAMLLMLELHNYNTFFLNSGNLLKQSTSLIQMLEVFAQRILMTLQVGLSQDDSQHSTNSDTSMT